MSESLEFQVIRHFFEREHLVIKKGERRETLQTLRPPSWHGGGRIPRQALYHSSNVKLLQFDIVPAVDIVHATLGSVKSLAKTKYDDNVGIRLIPKVLRACGRRSIPQNYVPGILLLYLEHCEGATWRHLVPSILKRKQKALSWIEKILEKSRALAEAGKAAEAKEFESNAKLQYEDWSESMIEPVIEFVKEMNAKKQNKVFGNQ